MKDGMIFPFIEYMDRFVQTEFQIILKDYDE